MASMRRSRGVAGIGHRVVHGGEPFTKPTLVSSVNLKLLSKYNHLAPLHNPINLSVIKICRQLLLGRNNYAVFDTEYYSRFKPEQFLYGLPINLYRNFSIRRYGFHGISHKYVSAEAAKKIKLPLSKLNIISLHLGSGCSITATRHSQAIATSMGFTPLSGLVMGTRSGDIDPGALLEIQEKLGLNAKAVNDLLARKSGLLGLSGFTSDMREILKAAGKKVVGYYGPAKFSSRQKAGAKLAINIFIARIREYLFQYAGLLKKVDIIVFTGGIGERSQAVRQLVMENIAWAKLPQVLIVKTDEERAIFQAIRNSI